VLVDSFYSEGEYAMKLFKCDKHFCKVFVPYATLVLAPRRDTFEPVLKFPVLKRLKTGVIVELPRDSVLRVGKVPNAKYYLLDGELVELKGVRAKILGLNKWGWHYYDPRTGKKVVTVVYVGEFKALETYIP